MFVGVHSVIGEWLVDKKCVNWVFQKYCNNEWVASSG